MGKSEWHKKLERVYVRCGGVWYALSPGLAEEMLTRHEGHLCGCGHPDGQHATVYATTYGDRLKRMPSLARLRLMDPEKWTLADITSHLSRVRPIVQRTKVQRSW